MRLKNLLLLGCLVACSTVRTSTPEERQIASATLLTVETTVLSLHASGKIAAKPFNRVMSQIHALRIAIAQSETTPAGWLEIYQQVLNLSLQWIPSR